MVKRTGSAPVDLQVGKIIRSLRMRAGLSQEAVGIALGLTFQQIQKYEKGTNRVAPSRLAVMAKLFKVPVSAFFNEDGQGQKIFIDPRLDTRKRHELITALEEIDDSGFDTALLKFIQRIAATKKQR